MNKLILWMISGFIIIGYLGLNSPVSADVLIPIAKNVWLETKQDYPDFDFYVGTFQRTSYYDKGRHYQTLYDSLKLIPAQLTTKTPHRITPDFYGKDEELYLVAIKKDAGLKSDDELKKQVIAVAKGEKNAKILLNRLNYQDTTGEKKISDRSKTYTLEAVTDTAIKTSERSGEPSATVLSSQIPVLNGGYSNYLSIVIGLLIAALITAGGLFFFRRR